MKNENLEKYIGELSPEMQEKARQCKDMQELNALLAENEVELSEDALSAVAGGCSSSEDGPTCEKCGAKKKWKSLREWSGWVCPNGCN